MDFWVRWLTTRKSKYRGPLTTSAILTHGLGLWCDTLRTVTAIVLTLTGFPSCLGALKWSYDGFKVTIPPFGGKVRRSQVEWVSGAWTQVVRSRELKEIEIVWWLVGGTLTWRFLDWRGGGGGKVGLAPYLNYNLTFALLQRTNK
jgi:hypothetical protein